MSEREKSRESVRLPPKTNDEVCSKESDFCKCLIGIDFLEAIFLNSMILLFLTLNFLLLFDRNLLLLLLFLNRLRNLNFLLVSYSERFIFQMFCVYFCIKSFFFMLISSSSSSIFRFQY